MLFQYFTARERAIQELIDFYENKPVSSLSSSYLHDLEFLRMKKEVLSQTFKDLCDFVVDLS